MGSHFRFGNHWFPRFRSKVTYLDNHSFQIRDESGASETEVPVNPVFLDEVFSYLENILILGQPQSWSKEWLPVHPLPINTPVCALDRQNHWFLGKIGSHLTSSYIIKWDNTNWMDEVVAFEDVVLRLLKAPDPQELVSKTVLVLPNNSSIHLQKVLVKDLIDDKTTNQCLLSASNNAGLLHFVAPEQVLGILPNH